MITFEALTLLFVVTLFVIAVLVSLFLAFAAGKTRVANRRRH